jgi:hypothetical protein
MRKDQQKQPYTVAAWRLVKKEDKLTVNGKDYHWCTSNHYSSIVKHNRMYADHKSNDHDIWWKSMDDRCTTCTPAIGGEFIFFSPRYSFPARKKRWDTTQNTETSQQKQAKVCDQTKIADVVLSPSQGEATSTPMHPTGYTIAQRCSGIGRNAFVQTFISLLGRSGQRCFA